MDRHSARLADAADEATHSVQYDNMEAARQRRRVRFQLPASDSEPAASDPVSGAASAVDAEEDASGFECNTGLDEP